MMGALFAGGWACPDYIGIISVLRQGDIIDLLYLAERGVIRGQPSYGMVMKARLPGRR